ncbi:class I SAM-dependent methyltransferase [Staphylospora marina]|uniref:class I SAM-dependent methyltransferase n=1 Tax=Staphylospora marina TaxID=2490858 RepID=UPI0013DE565F|nr:class I SAM-dependent methyltransferase [Staphylospora marina]
MFWDRAYREGLHGYWDNGRPTTELAAVMAYKGKARPGQTALDIGCGTGRETVFLAGMGYRAIGVDLSPTALKLAGQRVKETGIQAEFLQADVTSLPLEDESVDFANDQGCFHAVPDEAKAGYASELYRVLKPGGEFFLRGILPLSEELTEFVNQATGGTFPFYPVTEEAIDRYFPPDKFDRGPAVCFMLGAKEDAKLPGLMVILRKK